MAAANAHLRHVIGLYSRKALAADNQWRIRAAAGDPAPLVDGIAFAIRELGRIGAQIEESMVDAPPTSAEPGSLLKLEQLRQRVAAGRSAFISGDAD